jgi:hypothetical protein
MDLSQPGLAEAVGESVYDRRNPLVKPPPGGAPHCGDDLDWRIVPVTVLSVLFVLTGVSFRTGWLAW